MSDNGLGQSIARREDRRFVTGQGSFTDNFNLPGQLYCAVLRSPHAHADITLLDIAEAEKSPGVVGVHTFADLSADGVGPLPCGAAAVVATEEPLIVPPRQALADGRVRHVGDPVAFVVAESLPAALDALELIEVDYAPLPAVTDSVEALRDGAPQLWPQAPGNLPYRFHKGDAAAVEKAFEQASHIVELKIKNNRVAPAPTETRAALAVHDTGEDALTLTLTGQGVHGIRNQLAKDVFKLPPEKLRVLAHDVGGGFGLKNFVYPEYVMILWAARHHGRPVKWVSERVEDFMTSTQARDLQAEARLALDESGKFLALSALTTANMGGYLSGFGPGSSTNAFSTALGGTYDIPAIHLLVRGAFTNTVPVDAYRGAGKPEANYITERLIDAAARQTGIDRVELRRRNMVESFPHTTALGITLDSGGFGENIDLAVARADRDGFEARRTASAARGRLRGMGIACFLETARGAPSEGAEIKFRQDGSVELLLGTESNGQGHETTFPQIAAEALGLPMETFAYVQADTAQVRSGNGHGGARSMHMGGSALMAAVDMVLAKAQPVAAQLLQAEAGEVEFADGRFKVAGSDRAVPLLDVAAAARDPKVAGDAAAGGLDSFAMREDAPFTFPSGCQVAEVEIDAETGALSIESYLIVDDYGRLLNPQLTSGQVQGGVTQGIGQAMMEEVVYDPDSGQLLSASMMDYCLPRAKEMPAFEVYLEERPTKANPLGVKGSGQAGAIAAPQVIVSAVLDALAPLGVDDIDMPVTSECIWRAIRASRV